MQTKSVEHQKKSIEPTSKKDSHWKDHESQVFQASSLVPQFHQSENKMVANFIIANRWYLFASRVRLVYIKAFKRKEKLKEKGKGTGMEN